MKTLLSGTVTLPFISTWCQRHCSWQAYNQSQGKKACRKYRAVNNFWTKAAETVKNRIIQGKAKHNKLGKS